MCGFLRRRVIGSPKDEAYLEGTPIAWPSVEGHRAEKCSYSGEIPAAFYGCDTTRFLKSLIAELICKNEGLDVDTSAKTIIPAMYSMYIQPTL